jgi:hypothetical protein
MTGGVPKACHAFASFIHSRGLAEGAAWVR